MADQKFALDEDPPDEEWMTTYADMVTLLMCFFVMLASISKIDIPLYEQVMAGIQNEMGQKQYESPTKLLKTDIEDVVYAMDANQAVDVGTDDKGVIIELASSAFYRPGSADIRPEAAPVLERMAQSLKAPRYRLYTIEIEGHTDDDPIHTVVYPSNWELSASRATRVARFLIDQGIVANQVKAAGFAETRPKVPNRDAKGAPIPANQATNRRVVLRVYPMDLKEREESLRPMRAADLAAEAQGKPAPTAAGTPPAGTGTGTGSGVGAGTASSRPVMPDGATPPPRPQAPPTPPVRPQAPPR